MIVKRLEIVPAILTKKLPDLRDKIKKIKSFGASKVQIDIADNKFVPNKTIGTKELKQIHTSLDVEAHLMVYEPQNYVEQLAKAKVKTFIFHIEAMPEPQEIIKKVKKSKMKVGLALNPKTSISFIEQFVSKIDMILFLSVEPGFQGRGFVPAVLGKIREFRNIFPSVIIGIDGGIKIDNFQVLKDFDINEVVVGSGIWQSKNPDQIYRELLQLADMQGEA